MKLCVPSAAPNTVLCVPSAVPNTVVHGAIDLAAAAQSELSAHLLLLMLPQQRCGPAMRLVIPLLLPPLLLPLMYRVCWVTKSAHNACMCGTSCRFDERQ
jgi:hypothetical protein